MPLLHISDCHIKSSPEEIPRSCWRTKGRPLSPRPHEQAKVLLFPFLHTVHPLSPALTARNHEGPRRSKQASSPTVLLLAKPAEVAQGDSDEETRGRGLLAYGEEVREKEWSGASLALQWQIPSGLHHEAASSLGPPPPTGSPLTKGHHFSGRLPSSIHWLCPEPGSRLE